MQFLQRAFGRSSSRIYMDYAAATPLSAGVKRVMQDAEETLYGNAGAIHSEGRAASAALSAARTTLARCLGVQPDAVFFTGSGTESNNLAISGQLASLAATRPLATLEVVTTKLEHPSVLAVLAQWETKGVKVVYVPLTEEGFVRPAALAEVLTPQTALVSIAYASSEVGVVQEIRKLAREIQKCQKQHHSTITFHVDASQAPLWLPCQMEALGADLLTLDAGKCHGPKGVGVLVRRGAVVLVPMQYGGGQEYGLRPATENVPSIIGAVEAICEAQSGRIERAFALEAVSRHFVECLRQALPECLFNGPAFGGSSETKRLPNNVHISLPGIETEFAVVALDAAGVSASTRSACSGSGAGVSVPVMVMYGDVRRAKATLRFTLSPSCTKKDVRQVAQLLAVHYRKMKVFDQ